ncbi:MAG: TlpA family protein disulfide reductase [Gammaproteobacteria bacterium]|nr:TlpA family protein disulfide reductase [Gammaproteobacteria bacterium]
MQKTHNRFTFVSFFLLLFMASAHAERAPDFSLPGDKSAVKLSSFKGKVVYVDFWASWCKPCRKSFPFMNDMHKRYEKKGLKVIGINLDSEKADADRFLKKFPADFTVAYDAEGKTPKTYKLSVMPTSYLIDRRGNMIDIHQGFKEGQAADLETKIKKALASK